MLDKEMIQWAILLLGGLSISLLARKDKWQKWGYLVGLLSEPFWILSSWQNKQWGIFILTIWYAYYFALGLKNHYKDYR